MRATARFSSFRCCGQAASSALSWSAARSRACSRARRSTCSQTFAAQSVLAIQNARLFEDVEARTRELANSLEELRAAQDRLIQTEKLASLGQLTAGIAHEIKNPLNFVNNFAALSLELIDELKDAHSLGAAGRGADGGVDGAACGNLDKVVQHGKRAEFDRQEHAAAFARGIRASAGLPTSMRSSRRVSTWPITARAPRSRTSTSLSSGRSIRPPARSTCCPRRSPGCSSI